MFRESAGRVTTLTCDLDFLAPCIPTGVSAILLTWFNVTHTRDVRTLFLGFVFHLRYSPLEFSVLFSGHACSSPKP